MTLEPNASFFVNSGVLSNPHDMYHLLRPLLRSAVGYRYFRDDRLVSWGTGPVERVLVGRPDLSSFFTPVSICINVGSFEYLEFETLPDLGLEYRLVQGEERVVLFLLPGTPQGAGRRRAAGLRARGARLRPARAERPGVGGGEPGLRPGDRRYRGIREGSRRLRRLPPATMRAMFERSVLPSGPRVISVRIPGARSFSAVVYVRAGSRLECREESGTAHFLEHLVFKGTASFPDTRTVSEAIEGVGGTSNAATDREATTYWARVPGRETERAMHVLGDLVTRPLLRGKDIENERTIIVEEIRSYRDDPGEFVFTLLDQAVFGDTPLGWEIAGSEESVRGLGPGRDPGFLAPRVPAVEPRHRRRR